MAQAPKASSLPIAEVRPVTLPRIDYPLGVRLTLTSANGHDVTSELPIALARELGSSLLAMARARTADEAAGNAARLTSKMVAGRRIVVDRESLS